MSNATASPSPDFSPDDAFATFGLAKYLRFRNPALPSNHFTITFWVQFASSGAILIYGDPQNASQFNSRWTTMEVRQNGRNLEIDFITSSSLPSTISILCPAGDTHFIALSFSQTGDTATISVYIDNQPPVVSKVQLINSEDTPAPITLPAGDYLCIGTRPPDNEGHVYFNDLYTGVITDLRVWKHVMTEAEILEDSFREVYGDEPDLCLALPLDADNINIDVNTADNLCGDIQDDPVFSEVVDQNGYLLIDGFAMPAGVKTLEWWMRCGSSSDGYIINYDDISNSDHPNDPSTNWILSYGGSLSINGRNTGIQCSDGEWHHIALVFDTSTESYYLDGIQVGDDKPRGDGDLLTGKRLIMGADNADNVDHAFSGQIQRFYVWNTALSDEDVLDRTLLKDIVADRKQNIVAVLPLTTAKITDTDTPTPSFATGSGLRFLKDIQPLSDGVNWFRDQKIFTRTALTDDLIPDENNKLVTKSVYRIIITCSTLADTLSISALESVQISVNDAPYVDLFPNTSINTKPNVYGKVQVCIPATDLRCPMLRVQTELMEPTVYHYIFPDIEVHKKLASMPPKTLSNPDARIALGIDARLSDAQVDNFQTVIQHISSTVQHTYNRTKHSITHDRHVLPINMQDPHFKFEFTSGNANTYAYSALSKSEVSTAVANATKVNAEAKQGFFAEAIARVQQATSIYIHTIENIGGAIIDGAENIAKDTVGAIQQVGEDIAHGDLLYAAQDLIRGGENIGLHLVRTAAGVVTAEVKGAGQLFALTIQVGEEMYQYFISHTGDVGRIISALFQKLSATVDKAIQWLKDKMPLSDIVNTQIGLINFFNTSFTNSTTVLNSLKGSIDTYLDELTTKLQSRIKTIMANYTLAPTANVKATHPAHSMAMEKVEWLLGRIHRSGNSGAAIQLPAASSTQNSNIDLIFSAITNQFGAEGDALLKLFDKSQLRDYFTLIASGTNAADFIVSAFWKLVQSAITDCINLAKAIMEKLIDLVIDMLTTLKNALNVTVDLGFVNSIYTYFTGDDTMTVLKLAGLLIAIPVTLFEKHALGIAPFASNTNSNRDATMFLTTPVSHNASNYATIYGVLHLGLGPLAIISDIRALVNVAGLSQDGKLLGWVNKMKNQTPERIGNSDAVIAILGAFLSVGAQFIGNPAPPNLPYALPSSADLDDPRTAPNYYAHVIWLYQWFGWGGHNIPTIVNLGLYNYPGAQTVLSYAVPIYDTVFGALHIWLMIALDSADRKKIAALYGDKEAGETLSSDHQNYLNWASLDGQLTIWDPVKKVLNIPVDSPLPRKTFGNVCDAIPEVGQIGLLPSVIKWTKGYSLLATMLLDSFGQIGEGTTVLVRTANNELY